MGNICTHCGSKKVMADLPLRVDVSTLGGARVGDVYVAIHRAPDAWVFKDSERGG